MSHGSKEIERVCQARFILERMRARLLCPSYDALDRSTADLNLASDCLRQVDVTMNSPIWRGRARQKIEPEVLALRCAIRSIQGLLKNAGRFYAGLARLMSPDEAPVNYTAAGTSGTPVRVAKGTVVVHG